jgi:chromosome partitioning protein
VALKQTVYTVQGIDLVPASLELAGAEMELVSIYGRERLLQQLLEPIKNSYDFIFIDCPPAIGMLTVNALTASRFVLVPLQAEFLPLKGLESFMRSLKTIEKQLNPQLEVLGYVFTKYDRRKKMNREVEEKLTRAYGSKVFATRIRSNIALAQAQEKGVNIFDFAKNSNGAQDYQQLAEEFLKKIEQKLPT